MKIAGKQLADTLRTESTPFDAIYSDRVLGDLNGAIRFTAVNNVTSATNEDTIGAYKVVYITGQSGNLPTIGLADADSSSMPAFGLTVKSSDYQEEVDVVTFGNLKGVDTSALSVGDILYVSTTPGEYTTTPPAGTGSKIQNIGMVVKSDTNGIIKVGGAGRSNATPNLDEGHFFLGDSNDQSVQSSYQLPTSIGTSGQVLASDGTNLVFQASSSSTEGIETFLTANITSSNLEPKLHYVLREDATTGVSIQLPTYTSSNASDFHLKYFKLENRNSTYSITINSVASLSNENRYYRTDGTLLFSGTLSETVEPNSTKLIRLTSFQQGSYGYWREYEEVLSNNFDNLADVAFTNLADNDTLKYDSSTGEWINTTRIDTLNELTGVNITSVADGDALVYTVSAGASEWVNTALSTVATTGSYADLLNKPSTLTLDTTPKTSGFSASFGYIYLVNASANSTLDISLPSGSSVYNRLRVFNYGAGSVRFITSSVVNSIEENEGVTSSQDYKIFNSNCIIDAFLIGSTYEWIVSPQLEIEGEASFSSNGEFLIFDNTTKKMTPSAYTLPTSIDTSGKVLASDGTNVTFQTISSGGAYTFDAISSNTNAQVNYHYSCDTSGGAFTLTLPALSGVTAGQEIRIKLATAGNDLTIARTGTDTIEGVSSNYVLSVAKSAITLVANVADTDWEII